jgi:hypothetical protein
VTAAAKVGNYVAVVYTADNRLVLAAAGLARLAGSITESPDSSRPGLSGPSRDPGRGRGQWPLRTDARRGLGYREGAARTRRMNCRRQRARTLRRPSTARSSISAPSRPDGRDSPVPRQTLYCATGQSPRLQACARARGAASPERAVPGESRVPPTGALKGLDIPVQGVVLDRTGNRYTVQELHS